MISSVQWGQWSKTARRYWPTGAANAGIRGACPSVWGHEKENALAARGMIRYTICDVVLQGCRQSSEVKWAVPVGGNVANVKMLPIPMLPVSNWILATGTGYWQHWQHFTIFVSCEARFCAFRGRILLTKSDKICLRSAIFLRAERGRLCY